MSKSHRDRIKEEMEGHEPKREPEDEEQDNESLADYLKDQFSLSAISIAQSEAKKNDMQISQPVLDCLADLSFRYTEQLAKDLAIFVDHAGRKTVRTEDVLISAHRNEQLSNLLKSFSNKLKERELRPQRKRKRSINKIISSDNLEDIDE